MTLRENFSKEICDRETNLVFHPGVTKPFHYKIIT